MPRRSTSIGVLAVGCVLVATGCYVPFDFDGNGDADVAYVTEDGSWFRVGEAEPFFTSADPDAFVAGVAGDYDGDGAWEAANLLEGRRWETAGDRGTFVFDPGPGGSTWRDEWIPVPANYDDDRATEPAWFSQADATWVIEGRDPFVFGIGSEGLPPEREHWDVPVPADYDGDKVDEVAVYRPTDGTFHMEGVGEIAELQPAGFPGPADYDGDGADDAAVLGFVPVDLSDPDPYEWEWTFELWIDGEAETYPGNGPGGGFPVPADFTDAPGDEVAGWWPYHNDPSGPSDALWIEGQGPTALGSPDHVPATLRSWLLPNILRLTFLGECYLEGVPRDGCPSFDYP